MINCAGFLLCGAVEDATIEEAKALFETNFFGALRVRRRAALPALRLHGGHIVNISGLAGVVALPFAAHYSASKFAVEGLSEGLRLEARPFGVKVVLVEPSYIHTKADGEAPHRRCRENRSLCFRLRQAHEKG